MPHRRSRHSAVVGAGPAGLMAAEILSRGGASVTVFDGMPSPGRKFLLAGRGGLNLTHSEDASAFLARYGAAADRLAPSLQLFGPAELKAWCAGLGIETFVGTSGRVFPTSFKTSPLLRAWLRRLGDAGVMFRFRHRWTGWDTEGRLLFETPDGPVAAAREATVLALGGASWPQLGSDGTWAETFRGAGHAVAPLMPANCGFVVGWSDMFRNRFEGQPLKNIAISFGGKDVRGDAVVTRTGLEGGPIYALASELRDTCAAAPEPVIHIALRPSMTSAEIIARLGQRRARDAVSNGLRKTLGLSPVAIGLLHEACRVRSLASLDVAELADLINAVPVPLRASMPLARAISTAGGVPFATLGPDLMLQPGVFVAGEMLDWEAPTGGYLLQACFATGVTAGTGAAAWLEQAGARAEAGGKERLVV